MVAHPQEETHTDATVPNLTLTEAALWLAATEAGLPSPAMSNTPPPAEQATLLPTDTNASISSPARSSTPPLAKEVPTAINATLPTPSPAASPTSPPADAAALVDEATLLTTAPAPITTTTPSSAEDAPTVAEPALLTPLTSAPASERAPSPDTFDKWTNVAKDAHYKRAHIFGRTRQMMRHKTNKMLVTASRGFERAGYLPTKSTVPRMFKRRYSIDVNTMGWNNEFKKGWKITHDTEVCSTSHSSNFEATSMRCRKSSAGQCRAALWAPLIAVCERLRDHFQAHSSGSRGYESGHIFAHLFEHCTDVFQIPATAHAYDEAEPRIQSQSPRPLPDPRRYQCFGLRSAAYTLPNTDIYLELGTAVIHNDSFLLITQCEWNTVRYEAWMRDESLGMALEVLRRENKCDEDGIGFADCNMVQTFLIAKRGNDTQSRHYDTYRQQFGDKRWIFLTLNDCTGGMTDGGTHWSLIVVDRVHKRTHYVDSLFIGVKEAHELAFEVSDSLLQILGEDETQWQHLIEWNSPNQNWNNRCKQDFGPCGPFVYKMTEMMVRAIKTYQAAGLEHQCSLALPVGFAWAFESQFHSYEVRCNMAWSIARWKAITESQRLTQQHDETTVTGQEVTLLDTPDTSSFGRAPAPSSTEESEAGIEEQQDQVGGVALDDDAPNCIVIRNSDDDILSEATTVVSDPADEIMLDDTDDAAGFDDIFHDERSGHRSAHHGEDRRFHRQTSAVSDLWELDGNLGNNNAAQTLVRVRHTTPEQTDGNLDGEVRGRTIWRRRSSDEWSPNADY